MHHRNHANSTSNHNSPQHIKQNHNIPKGPVPQTRKSPLLSRIAAKFKEKPATAEEVAQLRLNTVREELKTRKQIAKTKRPSRMNNIFGGGESRPAPSYRKSSRYAPQDSGMFGGNSSGGGWLMDESWNPSFSMFTGGEKKKGKNYKSGLEELF